MTLTPAYARDFKSASEVIDSFQSGNDWIINDITSPWDGKPTSIRDFNEGDEVFLRYNKGRKVMKWTVTKKQ